MARSNAGTDEQEPITAPASSNNYRTEHPYSPNPTST